MIKIKWNLVFLIILILVILSWVLFSWKNPNEYFSAPVHSIITIMLGLIVSYYLVQKKTDTRKKYELTEKLLEQAKGKIVDLITLLHNSDINFPRIMGLKRAIKNKLYNCRSTISKKSFAGELNECINEVKKLNDAIEDMMLAGVVKRNIDQKQSVIRILENIEYRCDRAIIKLWI